MQKYIEILVKCFEYDIAIYSQSWLYYCVFPVVFYTVFFMLKWWVLTALVWIPLACVFKANFSYTRSSS